MKAFVAVLLAAVFVAVLGQAPTNCNLNIRNFSNITTSFAGTQLNYCQTSQRQCCSNSFFARRIRDLREALLSGLREQISANGDVLYGINADLRQYIEMVFIPKFLVLLEAPINIPQNISTFNTTIRNNFYIRPRNPGEANFTVQGFTGDFIRSQINLIIHSIINPLVPRNNGSGMSPLTTEQRVCASDYFHTLVNGTTKDRIDRSVQQLRLSLAAVNRVNSWFRWTFLPNVNRYFNPLEACLRGFIRLRCQDCVANIPDTCRGVCNIVTYGCYSVIENGLSGQFNVLWNVTDQLVRISREAVNNVSAVLPNHLLTLNFANVTQVLRVVTGLISQCNIPLNISSSSTPSFPRPRTLNASDVMIDIPQRVIRNATFLLRRGLVNYGGEAPRFCNQQRNFNCWNGTRTVTNYVQNFNNTSIEGQINNPYLNVSVDELRRQVNELGNPVTDYLNTNTSFQEVAPQGLVIPDDTPYTGGSGAGSLMMSTFLMVFLTIFYALFT